MTLYDNLFFEITLTAKKEDVEKFLSFIKSGELDDFFEFDSEYIHFDEYDELDDSAEVRVILSNDDMEIEIDEFNTDEFLDVFCRAGRAIDIRGSFYDADDEEYSFISASGNPYYLNARNKGLFNDELDAQALAEDSDED